MNLHLVENRKGKDMFFGSKKTGNPPSEEDFIRSMQPRIDNMGFGYQGPMNMVSKGLNHFQYKSGRYDIATKGAFLDYYADDSMIDEEARILEKMMRIMVTNADVYVKLLTPTTIRLEIYL